MNQHQQHRQGWITALLKKYEQSGLKRAEFSRREIRHEIRATRLHGLYDKTRRQYRTRHGYTDEPWKHDPEAEYHLAITTRSVLSALPTSPAIASTDFALADKAAVQLPPLQASRPVRSRFPFSPDLGSHPHWRATHSNKSHSSAFRRGLAQPTFTSPCGSNVFALAPTIGSPQADVNLYVHNCGKYS
jgi:hypothetical protein